MLKVKHFNKLTKEEKEKAFFNFRRSQEKTIKLINEGKNDFIKKLNRNLKRYGIAISLGSDSIGEERLIINVENRNALNMYLDYFSLSVDVENYLEYSDVIIHTTDRCYTVDIIEHREKDKALKKVCINNMSTLISSEFYTYYVWLERLNNNLNRIAYFKKLAIKKHWKFNKDFEIVNF